MQITNYIRKIFASPKVYSYKDAEEDSIKEFCVHTIEDIEHDILGIRVRFCTQNVKAFMRNKDYSDGVHKECEQCLYKLWEYSRKKEYIDAEVSFDEFCNGNLSVFNITGSDDYIERKARYYIGTKNVK